VANKDTTLELIFINIMIEENLYCGKDLISKWISSLDYKKYTNLINCKVCRESVVEKMLVLFILKYQIIGLL